MKHAHSDSPIVVVADEIVGLNVGPLWSRRDLEQSDQQTVQQLLATLEAMGRKVFHYKTPRELADNAQKHRDAVVLSIFGGEASRNRMALVPAICETYKLVFIGPDVYGRIIAQDKEVSKRLAVDVGLKTPPWRIVRDLADLNSLSRLKMPCVVKPLLEGSSIGISQKNLVRNHEEATSLARLLLLKLEQPVLVEEFVSGREVAFIAIESLAGMHTAYSEVIVEGSPGFFLQTLFDAEEKANRTHGRTVVNIDAELSEQDTCCLKEFLRAFGTFGYCRIDGRHADGQFHFIEMTPDAWIDPLGQFAMAFTQKGWSYEDVIRAVLASIDKVPPNR